MKERAGDRCVCARERGDEGRIGSIDAEVKASVGPP
jgi:hypothetical protein